MLNASGSQHQFPMYASLLRHASSRRLALQDCAVVLSLAAEKVGSCRWWNSQPQHSCVYMLACDSQMCLKSSLDCVHTPSSTNRCTGACWSPHLSDHLCCHPSNSSSRSGQVQLCLDHAPDGRIAAAGMQGAALDECYSLAALALALHEVPRAWAQQARRSPRAMPLQVGGSGAGWRPHTAAMSACRKYVSCHASQLHVVGVTCALLAAGRLCIRAVGLQHTCRYASRCFAAAPNLQAFLDLLKVGPAKESHTLPAAAPDTPSALFLNGLDAPATPGTPRALAQNSIASSANGAAAAAAASDRAAEKGDAAAYKQQLAQLKEAMLGAVRLLACRVGTATELCEAVAGALAAAAAELGLAAPGAGGSAAAGGAAGAAGPFAGLLALVGSGAGVSASGAGAAGGAGSGAAEAAAAKQAADASEAAAAVMMLQCAAAATEAFVAQCSSSSSQAQPALVLPAGALPAGLVRAALPLLRAAPALVRRPVQRVLLALLPAAGKVRHSCCFGA